MFKYILATIGFIAGGVASGALGYTISSDVASAVLAGLIGGGIGAALIVLFYQLGIFLIGALFGAGLGYFFYGMQSVEAEPSVLLPLAVVFGLVALFMHKLMIIILTSVVGAWSVVFGLAYLTIGSTNISSLESTLRSGGMTLYVMALCWLCLAIAGIYYQFITCPKVKVPEETESDISEGMEADGV